MEPWDELDNEDGSDKDEGEANLALMAITPSEKKYESTFDSNSDGEDEVFSNLSHSNFISFIQEPMSRCQDKARITKTLKKEYDLLKEELKIYQNKVKSFEKDRITLVNTISDKNLSEHETTLQDLIITGLEKTKHASMIYLVSKSKGKCMGYNDKCAKVKAQLMKTSYASFSSNAQTGLKTCFVPASKKVKV